MDLEIDTDEAKMRQNGDAPTQKSCEFRKYIKSVMNPRGAAAIVIGRTATPERSGPTCFRAEQKLFFLLGPSPAQRGPSLVSLLPLIYHLS